MKLNVRMRTFLYLFILGPLVNFGLFALFAIENSVIPQMEKFENIDNLSPHKYSMRQFLEIASRLEQKNERIRIATYNVLLNKFDENLEEVNRWPIRLPRIVEIIREMKPDILCVQELYSDQLAGLLPFLEDLYAFYSHQSTEGELNGIFYLKNRFEINEAQVWPMSQCPEMKYSDTLTMLQLKDRKTNKSFVVFNTHLSFSKIDKREGQAKFIAKKIAGFAEKMPVVLTGDMNTFPNRPDFDKLPFYDGGYIDNILKDKSLKDAKEASLLGHIGPLATFTNAMDDIAPFKGTGTPGVILDHIYVSEGIKVLIHAVQPATVDGHFPSDHMPILIDCIIEPRGKAGCCKHV